MNNDLAKSRIYVGENEVYLIEGGELDVEFDYLSPKERTKAILELEEYIQTEGIHPIESEDGYIEVNEDTLIYVVETGEIDHAIGLEMGENPFKDERTERVLDNFYKDCLSFWNREKEYGTVLGKSPEQLAMQDVSSIKYDPSVPNGDLLDRDTKQIWLKEKKKKLLDTKSKEQIVDMEM
ncbi:hypothetical protein [Virgibacillus dakarensis]|uniref:hypothetical protein n=1 Tax=Virgibacillus dakarensis TaxID=1917889 RepID=UPI001121A9D6|nr:hypothetical protein [Virgibacillus dakarensis]